jgi:hypothetical protein
MNLHAPGSCLFVSNEPCNVTTIAAAATVSTDGFIVLVFRRLRLSTVVYVVTREPLRPTPRTRWSPLITPRFRRRARAARLLSRNHVLWALLSTSSDVSISRGSCFLLIPLYPLQHREEQIGRPTLLEGFCTHIAREGLVRRRRDRSGVGRRGSNGTDSGVHIAVVRVDRGFGGDQGHYSLMESSTTTMKSDSRRAMDDDIAVVRIACRKISVRT